MSIFRSPEGSKEMVTSSDRVVRSDMELDRNPRLPGLKMTEQMNVSNVPNAKSRRKERE